MDYFGDEIEIIGAWRGVRSNRLRGIFNQDPAAFVEMQRSHGKRFADRMLVDAAAMFGPMGRRVPLHFPNDLKSIECFAVDMRGANNPLSWRYAFEVHNQPMSKKVGLGADKPEEFVTSFSGFDLSRIFSAYDKHSTHYKSMETSVEQCAITEQQKMARETLSRAMKGGSIPE